ncbi:MAG: hypothetical protein WCO67_14845 [Betaproteobacteria bacterium]
MRSAIVASPDVYGLPVQIRTEEGNLPYSWSGEIDAPPQVQNLGQVVLQDSGVPASLVLARAQMSTSGLVTRLDILCGSPPFEDSVRSSVENLSFVPATSHGLPARAWVLLEFAFLPGNTATQFDPSLADQALESMRENCRKKISAAGG